MMKTPDPIIIAGDPSIMPDSPELSAEDLEHVSDGGWWLEWTWNDCASRKFGIVQNGRQTQEKCHQVLQASDVNLTDDRFLYY